jgi:prepilin-type N-terminal cleavage/methylation domain-containing protein
MAEGAVRITMSDNVPAVHPEPRHSERGVTLLETVVALSILLIVAMGLLPLGVVAISTTETQGHLVARVTEYSQDKMEQLLSLAYNDSVADTRARVATPFGATSGGTGIAVGGSADPAAPVALYVDYLDALGTPVDATGTAAPAGWFYKRVWQISLPASTTGVKQVAVTTTVARRVGSIGVVPRTTVVSQKTLPF